jgi:hypothetical protein
VNLPVVGRVRIPRPEHVAFYGALGALAALEIIEWPRASDRRRPRPVQNQHNRAAEEIGEALEEAEDFQPVAIARWTRPVTALRYIIGQLPFRSRT